MAQHNEVGKWGEELALALLMDKGYAIKERNWRVGHRDLDIIAVDADGKTLVFVEVKTRSNTHFALPEDAVTRTKIRNIARAADCYIRQNKVLQDVRFDIISIVGEDASVAKLEHIIDAFNPLQAYR